MDVPLDGLPVARVPVLEHRCELSGLTLHAIPPGEIEIGFRNEMYLLDINLNGVDQEMAVGSDRLVSMAVPENSYAFASPGTDLQLRVTNNLWGALIEVDPARAALLFAEAWNGHDPPSGFVGYVPALSMARIGRLLIGHFQGRWINRLYAEGLGLAALGLALAPAAAATAPVTSRRGPDIRLTRAIDHLEAHLGEALSVAELARTAAMSPGHFARAFKAETGEPVWAHIQRRRCERACELLRATALPIAEIAHRTGFASQAHLTTSLRRRNGVTPGALRRGD